MKQKDDNLSWLKLLILICIVICIASAGSHILTRLLKIKTTSGGYQNYGKKDQLLTARLYGSSIAYSQIDWSKIAETLGGSIECWASLGSTPSEWERAPLPSEGVNRIFIFLSAHDLNENILSDFRADYVPLQQTIQDLLKIKADKVYTKKVLEQYPMKFVHFFFPLFGKAEGVMTGIRDELKKILNKKNKLIASDEPKQNIMAGTSREERLSDWEPGRLMRRILLMRTAANGKTTFNGLKKLAIHRLINKIYNYNKITLIVSPVSPCYQKEFIPDSVGVQFNGEIEKLKSLFPRMEIIRLDLLPSLKNNAMFSDLVHANTFGEKIGTNYLLTQIENYRSQP